MLQRQKNSPSRLRFRPPLPGTFGLRLAASSYGPQERLRPTRAPCSVQGETYGLGRVPTRGERPRKPRYLRMGPGEILWISCRRAPASGERGVEAREQPRHVVEAARRV